MNSLSLGFGFGDTSFPLFPIFFPNCQFAITHFFSSPLPYLGHYNTREKSVYHSGKKLLVYGSIFLRNLQSSLHRETSHT